MLVEYKLVESNSSCNRVEMVFIRKDGRYSFKITYYRLGINYRFYDLRGSFSTKVLRIGDEIKDISKLLGYSRM